MALLSSAQGCECQCACCGDAFTSFEKNLARHKENAHLKSTIYERYFQYGDLAELKEVLPVEPDITFAQKSFLDRV